MYEIKEDIRNVFGEEIRTYTRDVVDCNILTVEAGANGNCCDLSDHGGRTFIRIKDNGGTNMMVHPLGRDGMDGFEMVLQGGAEAKTIARAFEFIAKVLREEYAGVYD